MTTKRENEILRALLRTHLRRLKALRDRVRSPRYIYKEEILLWIDELEELEGIFSLGEEKFERDAHARGVIDGFEVIYQHWLYHRGDGIDAFGEWVREGLGEKRRELSKKARTPDG